MSAFGKALVKARLNAAAKKGAKIPAYVTAKKMGVSASYLSSLEAGRRSPNIALLAQLCEMFPEESGDLVRSLGIKLKQDKL